jgi:hypothetical protein
MRLANSCPFEAFVAKEKKKATNTRILNSEMKDRSMAISSYGAASRLSVFEGSLSKIIISTNIFFCIQCQLIDCSIFFVPIKILIFDLQFLPTNLIDSPTRQLLKKASAC